MRNKLLATVAMTALIGCTSFAMAQTAGTEAPPGKATPQSPGGQQHQMAPGGATSHQQPGAPMKSEQPGGQIKPGGSAQNQAPQAPPEQNKGFSQEEHPGNATPQRGAQDNDKDNDKANDRAKDNDRAGANGNQDRMGQQNGGPGRASGGANVQLSQDQRTKIKDVVVGGRNVARVDSVNFNIRVGVAVPRTIHVAVLPPEVVTIVPEYRGFEYVVVGDQLLIIDPNTLEIVAILPA
jgi:type IV secretory pathway VirB10-like protein